MQERPGNKYSTVRSSFRTSKRFWMHSRGWCGVQSCKPEVRSSLESFSCQRRDDVCRRKAKRIKQSHTLKEIIHLKSYPCVPFLHFSHEAASLCLYPLSLSPPSDEVTTLLCFWKAPLPPVRASLLTNCVCVFLFTQCWTLHRPWWTYVRISRCSGILRCYCWALGVGVLFCHHPCRVPSLCSAYRLSRDFLKLYFCVDESEHFTGLTSDKHKGNHFFRSSRRVQAAQAGTHTHLSAERSHWLINHKYPDSALCTQPCRKDGLKYCSCILIVWWVSYFICHQNL